MVVTRGKPAQTVATIPAWDRRRAGSRSLWRCIKRSRHECVRIPPFSPQHTVGSCGCVVRTPGTRYYDEWARLLDGPLDVLLDVMVSPSTHACALRQENPFVDLVNQKERARIYRMVADAIDEAQPS